MKYLTRPLSIFLFCFFCFLPIVLICKDTFSATEGSWYIPFLKAFKDERIAKIIVWNAVLALGASLIASALAVPSAWLCSRTDVPFKKLFLFLAAAPLLIPSHTVAYAWVQFSLFMGEFVTKLSNWWHVSVMGGAAIERDVIEPLFPMYNSTFTAFVLGFYFFPIMFYGAYASFRASDPLQESAALIYHKPSKVWWRITLRAAAPYLLGSFAFTFLLCITQNGIPTFLSVNTFAAELFVFMSGMFDMDSALVYSFLMFVALLLVGWVVFRWLPAGILISSKDKLYRHKTFSLGRSRNYMTMFLVFVSFLVLWLPLLALLLRSFSIPGDPRDPGSYFSGLKYYIEGISYTKTEFKVSMAVSGITAMVSSLVALPIARMIAFSPKRLNYLLFVLMTFVFLTPGTIFGLGIILAYNKPWLNSVYTSPMILCITHIGRFLPLAIIVLAAGMTRVGRKSEYVARLHGVSDFRAYTDVFLPALQLEFWMAFLVVLIFSMADLDATSIVSPPKYTTITSSLYIMMHYGNEERVSAVALLQILLVVIPVVMYTNVYYLLRRPGAK